MHDIYLQHLSWSFGMNKHIPVVNLSDTTWQMILYVSGHTAIFYHPKENRQTLLQGHVSHDIAGHLML